MEQEQKQKQYEIAREQRYKNIMDRLQTQDFCVSVMKKRHENELEASRVSSLLLYNFIFKIKKYILQELEASSQDHTYVDALDDPKNQIEGPISQYRKFQVIYFNYNNYRVFFYIFFFKF